MPRVPRVFPAHIAAVEASKTPARGTGREAERLGELQANADHADFLFIVPILPSQGLRELSVLLHGQTHIR